MQEHRVGIIMNGVTGRMGTHQHLLRSIADIIKQGGLIINSAEVIMPDPILVGRNPAKLKKICDLSAVKSGRPMWTPAWEIRITLFILIRKQVRFERRAFARP